MLGLVWPGKAKFETLIPGGSPAWSRAPAETLPRLMRGHRPALHQIAQRNLREATTPSATARAAGQFLLKFARGVQPGYVYKHCKPNKTDQALNENRSFEWSPPKSPRRLEQRRKVAQGAAKKSYDRNHVRLLIT
jgi:hypothetical protein